jgi:transitional endoplasmic reticulum ATPase
MARALATEGQMNFLAVKGPELISKWLGESERALASLFRRARMASPAIIFFDEIDAIAGKRGSGDSPSSGRLLSQLLTELDGVNHTGSAAGRKSHRVVVVAATNRPDLLDTALTRPGRIDRMIYVGVPDSDSRTKIFELSLATKSCSDDIDIIRLSSASEGFSGAELVAICRDAALLALEEYDDPMSEVTPQISMRHLLLAIGEMQRQITPHMLNFYESYREKAQNA